jgi:hypothetical protein
MHSNNPDIPAGAGVASAGTWAQGAVSTVVTSAGQAMELLEAALEKRRVVRDLTHTLFDKSLQMSSHRRIQTATSARRGRTSCTLSS